MLNRFQIIALTANAFAEDIQQAMDAGMNAHVAKPLNIKNNKKNNYKPIKIVNS